MKHYMHVKHRQGQWCCRNLKIFAALHHSRKLSQNSVTCQCSLLACLLSFTWPVATAVVDVPSAWLHKTRLTQQFQRSYTLTK